MNQTRSSIKTITRGKAIRKNVFFSIAFKGLSIIISLLFVPLTLHYIDKYNYGIWMTISSILVWIYYFDIGIGSGLRTKLAEAIAQNKGHLAKGYISTAFYILGSAMLVLVVLYVLLSEFIDWNNIFNISHDKSPQLNEIMFIVITITGVSFVLKLIVAIFHALQYSSINEFLNFFSNFLSFLFIYIYTKTIPNGDLALIVYTFVGMPIFVYGLAILFVFTKKLKFLCPNYKYVSKTNIKDLVGLSGNFFVIQIINLILYSTTSLFISHFFTPTSVTDYSISYRYFSIAMIIFTIIINPYWGAITNAYAKQDMSWIKQAIKKLLLIWGGLSLLVLFLLLCSSFVYKIWLGKDINIPITMGISVSIYIIMFNLNNIFVSIINGIGKIRLQLYVSIIQLLLFLPLALSLSKITGASGIIWATSILLAITTIVLVWQVLLLIKKSSIKIINQ